MKSIGLLALITISPLSHGADFRLSLGIGEGDIDLSSAFAFEGNYAGDNALATSIYGGYAGDNNLLIDIGLSTITDDLLAGANDNLHLDTYELLVGYLYQNGGFYLEPKLGLAHWKLELEEGQLFHPGAEEKRKNSGTDPLIMLTAGYRFGELFGMSVSYKYQDIENGKAQTMQLGFDFAF